MSMSREEFLGRRAEAAELGKKQAEGSITILVPSPRPPRSLEERARLLREADERGHKRQEELERQGRGSITVLVPSPRPSMPTATDDSIETKTSRKATGEETRPSRDGRLLLAVVRVRSSSVTGPMASGR
jgi:hypothetical protein